MVGTHNILEVKKGPLLCGWVEEGSPKTSQGDTGMAKKWNRAFQVQMLQPKPQGGRSLRIWSYESLWPSRRYMQLWVEKLVRERTLEKDAEDSSLQLDADVGHYVDI